MLDIARLKAGSGYPDLLSRRGFSQSDFSCLPDEVRIPLGALMLLFVAGNQTTQIDKALLALKYYLENGGPTRDQNGRFSFSGRHGTYTVDLAKLTCTCPLFAGELEGRKGMCSHLILTIILHGLKDLRDPATLLTRFKFKRLIGLYPTAQVSFEALGDSRKITVLALLAAILIDQRDIPARQRQCRLGTVLIAVGDAKCGERVEPSGGALYDIRGRPQHHAGLDGSGCSCAEFDQLKWCYAMTILSQME